MAFGLDSSGFTKKRLADTITTLNAAYKEAYGEAFLVDTDSAPGKQIGVHADEISLLWEGLQAVWDGLDVDSATGVSQDRLYSLVGLTRLSSQPSTITEYLSGTPGLIVPASSAVSVQLTGDLFQSTGDVTLGSIGTVAVASISRASTTATVTTSLAHGFATDDVVFIKGADQDDYNILTAITVTAPTTFTYAVSGSPTTPATGTINALQATAAAFESVEDGEIEATAGTLTEIETTVSGWDYAENLNDADIGREDETDAEFRTRYKSSLTILGAATFEAIRSALLNTTDVTATTLLENDTGLVDGDGLPPHSISALMTGGADNDIAQTLFDEKAAGIETFGTESGSVTDSQGDSRTFNFDRLTSVQIDIIVTVTKNTDENEGPVFDTVNGSEAAGEAAIKAALVAYGQTLSGGYDVRNSYMESSVGTVQGMVSYPVTARRDSDAFASTDITIGAAEVADIDTANITVNFV
jgi:uncharacterized phage protein gp47/JayE